MTIDVPEWAAETARALPYPLIFATVSGAHLYGFASVDSDLDVRACHLLPAAEVLGLRTAEPADRDAVLALAVAFYAEDGFTRPHRSSRNTSPTCWSARQPTRP